MRSAFLMLYGLNWHHFNPTSKIVPLLLVMALDCIPQFSHSQPTAPVFQPVDLRRSAPPVRPQLPGQVTPILPNDPYREQNLHNLQQSSIMSISGQPTPPRQTLSELMQEDREEGIKARDYRRMISSKAYQDAFEQFLQMNPDNFSITKAVYLSESAWYDNNLSYEEFEEHIKGWAAVVKQNLRKEGLNEKDYMAVMYGIQKLFSQSSEYYDTLTRKIYQLSRLQYSFDDYMGDKDWTNMFVTKLLRTKSGQCHSLPLLFLCIAEQLNTKAWLSLSPNHSFIQYFDRMGSRFNFETTNGNMVSQAWLTQSTYTTATALKIKPTSTPCPVGNYIPNA